MKMVESGSIKLPRIVVFVAEARLHFIVVVRKRRSASPDLVQPDRAQSLFAATNDDNVVGVVVIVVEPFRHLVDVGIRI